MLEAKNISVKYKNRYGIKNASLNANDGEIIGLIGADGAGKSSLLYAIAGVISFKGEIVYNSTAYHSPKEANKIKEKIGFMPQGLGLVLYDLLTVKEHIVFFRNIRNVKKDSKYENRLLQTAGLENFLDRKAKNLSGGMRQKLSLILTLLHKPKLLILDEPTTGVDPFSRNELWNIINDIRREENIIALISTAYMQEARKMDKILLFSSGGIIARGTINELLKSVEKYTYKGEIDCKNCLSSNQKTYSLSSINLPKAAPDLEALFFINALKLNKKIPKIEIKSREKNINLPSVVMFAQKLTKKFGNFIANDNIDMDLKKGEVLGLLGANGAGKTTFIKMLLGLSAIDEGKLYLLGKEIKSYKDRISLKSMIGYISQKFALYSDMTVRENMIYFSNMHKIPFDLAHYRIKKYADMLGFKEYMDYLPKELPLGINQRFSISVALLNEPVILFLDEPTSGIDTIARAQFWKLIKELKVKWGISILITTHYMNEAKYCDRIVFLKQGKKIVDSDVDKIHKNFPNANGFEEIFLELYG